MFFDVFRINGSELFQRYSLRKNSLTSINNNNHENDGDNDYQNLKYSSNNNNNNNNSNTSQNKDKLNLIDHHLAILLVALIDAELLEVFITICNYRFYN